MVDVHKVKQHWARLSRAKLLSLLLRPIGRYYLVAVWGMGCVILFLSNYRSLLLAATTPLVTTTTINDGVPCQYHGNCPIGTVCEFEHGSSDYGRCLTYVDNVIINNPHFEECVQMCEQELQCDEQWR